MQAISKNEFRNSTFHQLHEASASIRILPIHSLAVNLFPVKINQVASAGRLKHFVKNWLKPTNDLMIMDILRGYEIPFVLPPRQSRLPNLCHLTKEAISLANQDIQNMLRKVAIVASDPKEVQCLSSLFLA